VLDQHGNFLRRIAVMARLISVHEYELKPRTDPKRFEQTVRDAETRGLFDLPGLISHHFVRGVKGARREAYAAVWVYESREAWERLWGTLEQPRTPEAYPEKWRIWEQELLAPILNDHPDAIRFTAYEELPTEV
jgi:heme-degrading monooxygenase HmoA